MFAKSSPNVSLQSCLTWESYDVKFGMDECARNNYGVTVRVLSICRQFYTSQKILNIAGEQGPISYVFATALLRFAGFVVQSTKRTRLWEYLRICDTTMARTVA